MSSSKSEEMFNTMEASLKRQQNGMPNFLHILGTLVLFLILASMPFLWYYNTRPVQDNYIVIRELEIFAYGKPQEHSFRRENDQQNTWLTMFQSFPYWKQQQFDDREIETNMNLTLPKKIRKRSVSNNIPEECSTPDSHRYDCHPEPYGNKDKCEARGCCWYEAQSQTGNPALDVPWCFYPKNYITYAVVNHTQTTTGYTAFLSYIGKAYYPNPVKLLKVEITFPTKQYVNVKIFDAVNYRYEVPYIKRSEKRVNPEKADFEVFITGPFNIIITQRSTGIKVFETGHGGFIYTDLFLQFTQRLPSPYIYGLGERRDSFLSNVNWKRYTMFAADQPPRDNSNLYGSHPFYLALGPNGNSAVGVLLLNSNAMDVVLQPVPAITYRTLGGIFDFHIFAEEKPNTVISEYVKFLGLPPMPPYWSLGFHLCRYGYGSSEKTRKTWEANRQAGVPFDVQWNDIDYMDNQRDFTYDKNNFQDLPQLVEDIHKAGMHYVVIIDPGIDPDSVDNSYPPFDDGIKQDIFIKNYKDEVFYGKVWSPVGAVYPDFTHPNITHYWTDQLQKFYNEIPYDGLWIDMNEPSNFINGEKDGCPADSPYEYPPFIPDLNGGLLAYKTLCMTAKQHASIHYNVHNIYGFSEAIITNTALKTIRQNKRPFIISRSTFPGHGHYAGHWSGDNFATWEDMQKSIPAILDFSLFGVPLMGADICGFLDDTTVKLCQRWMELGAFYPFSRNHNTIGTRPQDPVSMGPEVVSASIKALQLRYFLLPYLYTLFYRAAVYGETVARPLVMEFPKESKTYGIDSQFLWGSSLMILPVVDKDVTRIHPYFPKGKWYLYEDMSTVDSIGSYVQLDAPLDTIHIAFRGGTIFPVQQVKNTTTEGRKGLFGILAMLDNELNANGELFWDDGESDGVIENGGYNLLKFTATKGTLTSTVVNWGAGSETMTLGMVFVLGLDKKPSQVTINEEPVEFLYVQEHKMLSLKTELSFDQKITMAWN